VGRSSAIPFPLRRFFVLCAAKRPHISPFQSPYLVFLLSHRSYCRPLLPPHFFRVFLMQFPTRPAPPGASISACWDVSQELGPVRDSYGPPRPSLTFFSVKGRMACPTDFPPTFIRTRFFCCWSGATHPPLVFSRVPPPPVLHPNALYAPSAGHLNPFRSRTPPEFLWSARSPLLPKT